MIESWRPVIGHEGLYEVSDLGNVRSLDRDMVDSIGRHRSFSGTTMAPSKSKGGYLLMKFSHDGVKSLKTVHRVVLEAWAGPCPAGHEACHFDGDRTNNAASNLRWDTRRNNNEDKRRHGTTMRGERNPGSRLTVDCVRDIILSSDSNHDAATRHGVTKKHIGRIRRREQWGWVDVETA